MPHRVERLLRDIFPDLDIQYISSHDRQESLELILLVYQRLERDQFLMLTDFADYRGAFVDASWKSIGLLENTFTRMQETITTLVAVLFKQKSLVLSDSSNSEFMIIESIAIKQYKGEWLVYVDWCFLSTAMADFEILSLYVELQPSISIDRDTLNHLNFLLEWNRGFLHPHVEFQHKQKRFHPSFLVPLIPISQEQRMKLVDTIRPKLVSPNAFLAEAAKLCDFCFLKPGTKKCSNCKKRMYCSRECQDADWKEHKQDCQKPVHQAEPVKHGRTILCNSSLGREHQGYKIENVYGERQFLVRVQLPIQRVGNCMITDRNNKVQFYVTDRNHCVVLMEAIQKHGAIGVQGKTKGYFYAKQEAKSLRIWIDDLPTQNETW
jgi:hypothetical protein